jgi:hypothetical protein
MDGPRIVLPSGFEDRSGLYLPSSFEAVPQDVVLPPEFRPRVDLLVVGQPPSFYDQIYAYATEEEIGFDATPADVVVAITEQVKFWPSMRLLSRLQRDLWGVRLDQKGQIAILNRFFGGSTFETHATRWVRHGDQRVLFSEQQIFALQRLVLLNGLEGDVDEPHTPEEYAALLAALVAVPGSILGAQSAIGDEPAPVEDERWMRLFVGHGGFVGRGALRNELGRAFRLYGDSALRDALQDHQDFCPIDEWLIDQYGLSFVEMQAMGFALHAGSKMLNVDELPTLIDGSYFTTTLLADKAKKGLDALSESREWYLERFAASQSDKRRAAFEITPFLQRPALRQPDGKVMPFAPRALEAWMGATGNYYRLFDIARDKGSATRKTFTRFNGLLVEAYVHEIVERAYPPRAQHPSIWLPGAVHREQVYKATSGEGRTPDVAIDLTPDLVLLEVTSSRLTERSVVDADPEAVRKDIEKVVTDKIEQLGAAIVDIRAGVAQLPGIDISAVERIWPLIVISEGVFQTPTLWAYIAEAVEESLTQPNVQPLTLLDLEDVEELFGLIVDGQSMVEVLRAKTSGQWAQLELALWLRASQSGAAERSPIAREHVDAAFDPVVQALFTDEAIEEHRARLRTT